MTPRKMLARTLDDMRQTDINEPLRFAAALTDGDALWAIASEPLGDDSEHWTPLAPGRW